MYGDEWLEETYHYIVEDEQEHFMVLKALLPLARTPMDKDSAKAMEDYDRRLAKMLDSMTPWRKKVGRRDLSELRKKVKSGTIVVIPDASDDPDDPIYKDATFLKG